ncbi:uncharacterized protein [Watersipora subatra]|uniref:uncharacterized protein n=1 Tax=Watersipora subatra TaxID=2589382 RepID=UPI00355B2506
MAILTSNQTGILSFSSTMLISVLLIICYTLDRWEIVQYNTESLQSIVEKNGLDISVNTDYYIITLNSTIVISNETVARQLVLAKTIEAGMWKSCAITNDGMDNLVNNTPSIDYATDNCTYYRPMGASPYLFGSGRYIRHMMTRTAQSCMIVSSICVLATLILGTASLAIKHAILSMIASTVCAAAVTYQMLSMALMLRRQGEAAHHLKVTDIPFSLEESVEVKFGTSTYLSIICQVLGICSVALWVAHTKILRGAIKKYIAETKYNLFCRT